MFHWQVLLALILMLVLFAAVILFVVLMVLRRTRTIAGAPSRPANR